MPQAVRALPRTLWEFVQAVPFEADKEPLEFVQHRYLVPLYQAIVFDPQTHPDGFRLVVMKGAQVGMTVTAFAALVMAALAFWGKKFGYFLPTEHMAHEFSSDRFAPLLRSNPFLSTLYRNLEPQDGTREDRKGLRMLGETSIYFRSMRGAVSTEAIPMAGIFFDEVRRMFGPDVQRAEERIAHSAYPINVKLSTAGYPDTTIDQAFKQSDQRIFHSACRCPEGIALAWSWPACIGERHGEVFYRCPRCDTKIADPRQGRYVPRTPEKAQDVIGFHLPQILSPRQTAATIWAKWLTATDRQEFYTSVLGIPWLDPTTILVPEEVARACVDPRLHWERTGLNCVMGVDQRGGENHVVIGKHVGGKLVLHHLEIIQDDAPFDRLSPLMEQFDVDCCVVDALPSYNEAVRFAKAFRRRVFLAYYTPHVHMLRWSDRDEELHALVNTDQAAKFECHVMLDRYKAIEYALMQWVLRQVACPPPDALVQPVRVKGLTRTSQICLGNPDTGEQGLFFHLRSVARRTVDVQRWDSQAGETFDTGEFRMEWENIGFDPHFLHAFTYCCMAAARRDVLTRIWMDAPTTSATVQDLLAERPTLTPTQAGDQVQIQTRVLPVIQAAEAVLPWIAGTCGACRGFLPAEGPAQAGDPRTGQCGPRRMTTQASYPACEQYDVVEEERP